MKNPCYKCPDRHVLCQSSCERRKEYCEAVAEERKKVYAKRAEEKMMEDFCFRGIEKVKKKRNGKKNLFGQR